MIAIIDYGVGNTGSILNMLKKVGARAVVSRDISEIKRAEKLILPGVGAFDNGMKCLKELGLIPTLERKVLEENTPILGICLGAQLLTKKSEEGTLSGLGWFNAEVRKFRFDGEQRLKVPHMGWNYVVIKKGSVLFTDMYERARFYFVHSYYIDCYDESDILTITCYGREFVSSIMRGNIVGVQFHPEKSHKFGMKLLKNFVELIDC